MLKHYWALTSGSFMKSVKIELSDKGLKIWMAKKFREDLFAEIRNIWNEQLIWSSPLYKLIIWYISDYLIELTYEFWYTYQIMIVLNTFFHVYNYGISFFKSISLKFFSRKTGNFCFSRTTKSVSNKKFSWPVLLSATITVFFQKTNP